MHKGLIYKTSYVVEKYVFSNGWKYGSMHDH